MVSMRPIGSRWTAGTVLVALGLGGLSQTLPPLQLPLAWKQSQIQFDCPIDFKFKNDSLGVKRITRHPQLWALGSLGLGLALTTPFLAEICLLSFPILFAYIGGWHQDVRHLKSGKLSQQEYQATSLVPFAALIQGQQRLDDLLGEIKWFNLVSSLGITGLMMWRRRRIMSAWFNR